jgi:hypothetical protein
MKDKPYFTLRIPIPDRQYLGRLLRWLIPNGGTLILIALLVATQSIWARPFAAMSTPGPSATTVNYQGRLADNAGTPLDGVYGMSFALYDAASAGNLVWGPEDHPAVPVSDGLFSVGLGSRTTGGIPTTTWNGDRYLEITVSGETLSPRELIRAVPIAGMALTVPDGAITSRKVNFDQGTMCLSSTTQVTMPGDWQMISIPGLRLDFSLASQSQVLVWIDGLARMDQSEPGQTDVIVFVDNVPVTASFAVDTIDELWFNVKGQRLLTLSGGAHSITVRGRSHRSGTMQIHGMDQYKTCINYLVLGEQ